MLFLPVSFLVANAFFCIVKERKKKEDEWMDGNAK